MSAVLTLIITRLIDQSATASLREQIGLRLASIAEQTSDKLDQGMYERYREFELLSGLPFLGDPAERIEDKQRLLDRMQKTYEHYAWIGMTDTHGRVLAATKGMLVGADVSARPWFGNALKGIYIGDVHDAKLLASKLPNPSGEPMRFVDVAFPYRDRKGNAAGVVSAHMSWRWAEEVQHSVLDSFGRGAGIDGFIVASDGTTLVGPGQTAGNLLESASASPARAGKGYLVERWEDGKDYLVGYSMTRGFQSYPGLGWKVIVRQDLDTAFAPVRALQRQVLWIGLGLAVLFSCIGLVNARRISRPLVELAGAAKALRQGEADASIPVVTGYREAAELSAALTMLLDGMRDRQRKLEALNASLEGRIEERARALVISEARMRTITDSMPALIGYVDAQERVRFCNRVGEQWFQRPLPRLIDATVREVLGDPAYAILKPAIDEVLAGAEKTFEHSRPFGDSVQHLRMQFIPERGRDGVVSGFHVLAHDITDSKNYQLALQHDLLTDSLTGLPNRTAFLQRMEAALARARRNRSALAVMFLDVDRFKAINDEHGHQAGDLVLREFAQRLRTAVRETDAVARLSGDEFVMVAEDLATPESDAQVIAGKMIAAIRTPFLVLQHVLDISTSIGVVVADGHGASGAELIKLADAAMYEAKRGGRNRIVMHRHERPRQA
ncbi:diguanylate cyclase domain-containing protein [Noviherbaspirillum galbum]|uniref:Diguanylate cyclase n=1 Tax=Noviherbaspirillum galbum TaxID=2709383 RepID=A0A6B3SF94_9BURK|nr:diguanylate cyclase [Noviherbaspirillum galbum]NEX59514.1 diguanylate cyclase [Noviherbaspirillum galbum]